jgi:hypothetical protein
LARWEPRHGRFRFRHPWKQYLKIGNLTRICAYKIEALSVYLHNSKVWHFTFGLIRLDINLSPLKYLHYCFNPQKFYSHLIWSLNSKHVYKTFFSFLPYNYECGSFILKSTINYLISMLTLFFNTDPI